MKSRISELKRFVLLSMYFFMISIYLYSSPPSVLLICIIFSALHELAHIAVAKIYGRRTSAFRLSFFGLHPDLSEGTRSSCIAIFAAGPVINLISLILCEYFFKSTHSDYLLISYSVNLLTLVFNLIPLPFSDGDGILRAIIGAHSSCPRRKRLCAALNLISSLLVFSFFSYRFLFLSKGLFSFFCSFVFLLVSVDRSFGE